MLAIDRTLAAHQAHWLVREIILLMKRTLKRLDLTARSFFALIEPGSAFAGSLFELALAADRSYMLDDPDREQRRLAVADERRPAADEQRPVAPADAVSRRTEANVAELLARAEPFRRRATRWTRGS